MSMVVRSQTDEIFKETYVKSVWFVGSHADVGGGAKENVVMHALSNVSLRWVVRDRLYDHFTANNNEPADTEHETNGILVDGAEGNGYES
ncbi:hypothetical protein EI94DRAFT_1816760 [Lactarius quietus]|nr:hypothetical protein EI94DRAFT_1816760 [Lactarius quietus]